MKILRNIGASTQVLVDTKSSRGISLDSKTAGKRSSNGQKVALSRREIMDLITGNEYLPLFLSWEITDKCNFSCPFCYIKNADSKHKTIPFTKTKQHIEKLIDKGMLFCLLTGGEPTIHPDFKEIYLYLKKRGVLVDVFTNGSNLLCPDLIDLFLEYKPYQIEVSIYGSDDYSSKLVTKSDTNLNKIIDQIVYLKEKGIDVVCKTPLNKITINHLENIQKVLKEKNIDHYFTTEVLNSYHGDDLNKYELDYKDLVFYNKHLLGNSQDTKDTSQNGSESLKSCFSCGAGKHHFHINHEFEMRPCFIFQTPETKFEIFDQGIDNALETMENFIKSFLHQPLTGCNGCAAIDICKMCPARAIQLNDKKQIAGFKVPAGYCESIGDHFEDIRPS